MKNTHERKDSQIIGTSGIVTALLYSVCYVLAMEGGGKIEAHGKMILVSTWLVGWGQETEWCPVIPTCKR